MKVAALFFAAALVALTALSGEPMALLSDNVPQGGKSKMFPEGTKAIRTGASYSWVETGEFATDKGTLKASKEFGGIKCLFDGGDWWKSQTYGDWDGGKWATLRIDLQKPYLIGEVDVWANRHPMRDTARADILFSSDGKTYTQHGVAENKADPAREDGDGVPKNFVKHSKAFEKPVLARYLEIRILKNLHQQQISEIAVWGWSPDENSSVSYSKADDKPVVKFSVRPIQDGAALISWGQSAKVCVGASKWRVYASSKPFKRIDQEGVSLVKEFGKAETSGAIFPFEPGSTVNFGMSAVYGSSEYPVVESSPVRFKTPYECACLGDMIAINHFIGGGAFSRSAAWEEFSLDLLAETPARESRWWFMFPETVKRFLSRGIGMTTWPSFNSDGIKNNVKNANSMGLHSFTRGNEPELNGVTPEAYAKGLREQHAKAKELSKWNTIGAPTCNIGDSALEWLDKFYSAGAKDCFDVLDLHTYCGAPENLFKRMDVVRAIMKKYGDEGKPLISTEFGYADCPEGKDRISPLQKAQYLARGLVIHYVLGFKRVYIYSFCDIGVDPYNNEHHFGLLDFDLQKKPSFHAVNALGRQLGDCVLEGPLEGCAAPSLGYLFKSQGSGDYVAIVWNPSADEAGVFSCASPEVETADIFGETRRIILDSSKSFSLPYGPSPAYIRAKSPIRMLSSQRIEGASAGVDGKVSFEIAAQSVIVKEDAESAEIEVVLKNGFKLPVDCSVAVKGADGSSLGSKTLALAGHGELRERLSFKLAMPDDVAVKKYSAFLSYKTKFSSYSDELAVYVRRLVKVSGGAISTTRLFHGMSAPMFILANKSLEASFDPSQGGRALELIDRGSLTNQLHLDYDKIPVLKSIPFEYGIWFEIDRGLKNDVWKVAESGNGRLKLSATNVNSGAEASMLWTLDEVKPELKLEASVVNKSGKPSKGKFYMHPEYNVSGYGESNTDILLFPVKDGQFKLPFWADLGERKLPPLAGDWWIAKDAASGLELRQDWSKGWSEPRIWFGGSCYNVEMSQDFELAPDALWSGWLTWSLSSPGSAEKGRTEKEKSFWDFFKLF